jgi:uncharacterized membrane protein YhaH (DUF805 family)
MGFAEAIRSVLRNAVNFRGRASRSEFWWWTLVAFAINVALSESTSPLAGLVSLAVAVPTVAVGVRRLHDTDRSAWSYLLIVVPIANFVLLYFFLKPGTPGSNRFGSPPVTAPPSQGPGPGFGPGPSFGPEGGPEPGGGSGPGGWDAPPPRPPLLG